MDEAKALVEAEDRELTVAEMEAQAQEDAGMGVSDRSEDNIQAFVKVLHQLSPELNSRESSYVKDAAPGDIWIAAQNLLIPGQEGFMFQQIGYQQFWVEWESKVPKPGSFPVDRHKTKPSGGRDISIGQVEFDNGHVATQTRYHVGLVYYKDVPPFPAVLTYSSTGAAVSTHWTGQQRAKRNKDGSMAPCYKYLWHMATVERSNEMGRWYLLVPTRNGEISETAQQHKLGRELTRQFTAQELKVAEQTTASDEIPF